MALNVFLHPFLSVRARMAKHCGFALMCLLWAVFFCPSAFAADPDLSGSARGIQLAVYSRLSPIEINQIHSWEVTLKDADGPLVGAELEISGGMPEHNHGMPTQPRVTEEISPGRYLLEGIRFHMPGKWQLTAVVKTNKNSRPVTIIIDFEL